MKGTTRIVVTHNLNYLSQFDRIVLMEEGKIIFSGTYVEIQDHPNFIEIQKILKKTELEMDMNFKEKTNTKKEVDINDNFMSVKMCEDNIDDINV